MIRVGKDRANAHLEEDHCSVIVDGADAGRAES